ncbi:MAG: hypothetical protein KA408_11730 [Flavobacteriales bacterium]|nr:hypothetical protein [Flavobacteriales bacterium]
MRSNRTPKKSADAVTLKQPASVIDQEFIGLCLMLILVIVGHLVTMQ